jgi:hypothetical protein
MLKSISLFLVFCTTLLFAVPGNAQFGYIHELGQSQPFLQTSLFPPYDFDADGDIDIVASGFTAATEGYFYFLENVGHRMFVVKQIPIPGLTSDNYQGSIDMDHNGLGDILIQYFSPGIFPLPLYVRYQTSPGVFTEPILIDGFPGGLLHIGWFRAFQDVDGDDLPDLFYFDDGDFIGFYKNINGTSFELINTLNYDPTCFLIDTWNCMMDFDDDSDLDFVYLTNECGIGIYENENGTFQETANIIYLYGGYDSNANLGSIILEDFNGDSHTDILYTNSGNIFVSTYISDLNYSTPVALDYGNYYNCILFDADMDGDWDVISHDQFYDGLTSYFINDGLGNFSLNQASPNYNFLFYRSIDLDNDSLQDIFMATANSSFSPVPIAVKWNEGNGLFSAVSELNKSTSENPVFWNIDNTSEGGLNLVCSSGSSVVKWTRSDSLLNEFTQRTIFSSDFANEFNYAVNYGYVPNTFDTDFDGDGDIDYVLMDFGSKTFWLENIGENNLPIAHEIEITTPFEPRGNSLFDIDQDNDLDFVYSTSTAVYYYEHLEGSDVSVVAQLLFDQLPLFEKILDDLDNDGDLDILINSPEEALILENEGNNILAAPISFAKSINEDFSVIIGDVNQDGFQDGFTAYPPLDSLQIWLSQDSLSYIKERIERPENFSNLFFSDVDADGDKDLVVIVNPVDFQYELWFSEFNGTELLPIAPLWASSYWPYAGLGEFLSVDMDGDNDEDILVTNAFLGVFLD